LAAVHAWPPLRIFAIIALSIVVSRSRRRRPGTARSIEQLTTLSTAAASSLRPASVNWRPS
jgi:hypothetical protein